MKSTFCYPQSHSSSARHSPANPTTDSSPARRAFHTWSSACRCRDRGPHQTGSCRWQSGVNQRWRPQQQGHHGAVSGRFCRNGLLQHDWSGQPWLEKSMHSQSKNAGLVLDYMVHLKKQRGQFDLLLASMQSGACAAHTS